MGGARLAEELQTVTAEYEAADREANPLAGFRIVPGYLDRVRQEALLAAIREILRQAPLYTPRMPKSGRPMSVRMTNCGPLGWMTDEGGYRYQATHPATR